MKKISVILPVYKEDISMIDESLNSIINQTYSNIEIIVIIDAPDRVELIKYMLKKQKEDKRITIVRNAKNIGLTASLNKGIRIAKGDYIARMDADDISMLSRLEKQLYYLQHNKLDLIGCGIIGIDENGRNINGWIVHNPINDEDIKMQLRNANVLFHPTWFGTRELFKQNKYYDFQACEDYEFLVRISLQGKRLGNIYEPLLKYRMGSSNISNTKRVLQKVGFLYLRDNYRKRRESNYQEYLRYMNSSEGIRKQKIICNYYNERERLKELIKKKSYLSFIRSLFRLYLSNSDTRTLMNDDFRYKIRRSKREMDK